MKITIRHNMAEALVQLIDSFLQLHYEDDTDRLIMCGLHELKLRLQKKMLNYQQQYSLKLTAVQALSVRLLYTDFLTNTHGNYVGNYLRQVAEEVHQIFSE